MITGMLFIILIGFLFKYCMLAQQYKKEAHDIKNILKIDHCDYEDLQIIE